MSSKRYPQCIMATVCIPWTESFQVDRELFVRQISHFRSLDIENVYVFGTAGEGHAVTDEQFDEITQLFFQEMTRLNMQPMVGIISPSLQVMKQRLERAYSLGVRDFQFALPGWTVLSDEEMFDFFHAFCDPYPDCRFMLYNIIRSKRLVTPAEFFRLADEIPNLTAAKTTSVSFADVHDLAFTECPIQFFTAETSIGYAGMLGEFGYLMAWGSLNPQRAKLFFQAVKDKDVLSVKKYVSEAHGVWRGIMGIIGTGWCDAAYDKVFFRHADPDFSLRVLPPYRAIPEEVYQEFMNFMESDYPQWLYRRGES